MKRLYFLGIGGTAMGALACACKNSGYAVSGSDAGIYSPMREFLNENEIEFNDGFSEENLIRFKPDVVVVGNVVSRGNTELEFALNKRIDLISMPELLRNEFIGTHTSIVVAGTHGKTTTSSLIAWTLSHNSIPTGFFIGAVPGNFSSGCQPVPVNDSINSYFVTEGDEYDTAFFDKRSKFISYRPDIAIINNIEFDHADIFSSIDEIKKSFRQFCRLVPANGLIIANADDKNVQEVTANNLTPIETFGLSSSAMWRAVDIFYGPDDTHFTVLRKGLIFNRFTTKMLGEHNIMNLLSVIAVANRVGLSHSQIQNALNSFVAPKRRLEEIGTFHGALVIDDFAHHPTAIRMTLKAATQSNPSKRIIACFEPRSNTTARNFFQNDLVSAFEDADVVVIGCVNRPERFADTDRLDRELLASRLVDAGKVVHVVDQFLSTQSTWGEDIVKFLSSVLNGNDLVVLLSNGDFGGLRVLLTNPVGNPS